MFFEIRSAQLTDLPALSQLFDAYRQFYKQAADVKRAQKFLQERMEREESRIYVAAKTGEGQLLGFTQLYPLFSSTRMKRLWLLNDLFVTPAYRGQRISVQLIHAAQQLCRDTDACGLQLETAQSNLIGNHLYPACGFELDREHNYYFWEP